ncbi:HEAT repeat domain-containing protein [Kitasatospora cheerisanensis]|nr:hypothetical protein [Kitasatospora cheerisanensis]
MRLKDVRTFTHRQLQGHTDRFRTSRAGEPFAMAVRPVLEEAEELAAEVAARTADPLTRAAVYVCVLLECGWQREQLAALGFDGQLLDAGDAARRHISRMRGFPPRAVRRATLIRECREFRFGDEPNIFKWTEELAKEAAGRPNFGTAATVRRLLDDLASEDVAVFWYAFTALTTLRVTEAIEPLLAARDRLRRQEGLLEELAEEAEWAAVSLMTPAHLPLALQVFTGPGVELLSGWVADYLRPFDHPAARAALERHDAAVERADRRTLGAYAADIPIPDGRDGFVRWLIDRVARNPYQGDFITALGTYGDASALPVLTATLGHEHGAMQARADRAIGAIGGRAARREAVLTVLRDPDAAHRRAAYAAGRLGLAEAVPELIAILRGGAQEAWPAAVAALTRLGASEAVPAILGLPRPVVGPSVRGGRHDLRLHALRRLGPGSAEELSQVEDLALAAIRWSVLNVRGGGGTALRDLATDVLARCDSPRATELVVQTLLHGTVRPALVRPLAERGDPALVEVMIHLVDTAADRTVRRLATDGILRAAHHPAADLDRLDKQLAWLRDATTRAWLEPRLPERPGRLERLAAATRAHPPRVRAQAVKSLALLGSPEALELVAGLREDPNRHVRACVEGALLQPPGGLSGAART